MNIFTALYLAAVFLECDTFKIRAVKEIKTDILYPIFFLNRGVYEIMWENMVQRGRSQVTIWRITLHAGLLRLHTYTHTHTHTHIHTLKHTFTYTLSHTHAHTLSNTHTHSHTHTHTQTQIHTFTWNVLISDADERKTQNVHFILFLSKARLSC
jgi:hypothetical protein